MNTQIQQTYEWGIYRKSTKRVWAGLTRREMQMIVHMIAYKTPHDWLIWHCTWAEWQELTEGIQYTDYETLKPNLRTLHVDIPQKKRSI